MSAIDLSNLRACTEDAKRACASTAEGPKDPTRYDDLVTRVTAACEKLPPLYRETVATPFLMKLTRMGAGGFREILRSDPKREDGAGLLLDIAQAILQHGEGYLPRATGALQEVVSDLYDGFMSAEDRRDVKPPETSVIAPMVKWGNPQDGPYTWPVDATRSFGLETGVVNFPPAEARRGLLGWASLAHETAGHDVMGADVGLRGQLRDAVAAALKKAKLPAPLPEYWPACFEETASDVMGILNMGPTVGIALIGFFRGWNAASGEPPALSNEGDTRDDTHPADILRGFLAAGTVRLLRFSAAADWARVIEAETMKDVTRIVLNGKVVTAANARRSAEIVARTLVRTPVTALERHALGDIQDWRDEDEAIVAGLRARLMSPKKLPAKYPDGFYAAHAVAAAVSGALQKGAKVASVAERMREMLDVMHAANPCWGPLYVEHPGDIKRDLFRPRRGRPARA